jgi:hypothetical protein
VPAEAQNLLLLACNTLQSFSVAGRVCRGVRYPVDHMNFGSLRVGNSAFSRAFSRFVPNSWRIENEDDIFAWVPRSLNYLHIGNGLRLLSNGKVGLLDDGKLDFGSICSQEVCPTSLPFAVTTGAQSPPVCSHHQCAVHQCSVTTSVQLPPVFTYLVHFLGKAAVF